MTPIYILNLDRRKDRRQHMENEIKKQNFSDDIKIIFVNAVDGQNINMESLFKDYGVKLYDKWKLDNCSENKYYSMDINSGQIGCALSNFNIWDKIVNSEDDYAIILQDDVILSSNFEKITIDAINILINKKNWLLYLGRERLEDDEEEVVNTNLVYPGFSYCLHSYVISKQTAKILLDDNYMINLIPTDDYVPAVCGEGWREDIKKLFPEKIEAFALKEDIAYQEGKLLGSDIEIGEFD